MPMRRIHHSPNPIKSGRTTISLVTHKTPTSFPRRNSRGSKSVTISSSSDFPSRSLVIAVTAKALTMQKLTIKSGAIG